MRGGPCTPCVGGVPIGALRLRREPFPREVVSVVVGHVSGECADPRGRSRRAVRLDDEVQVVPENHVLHDVESGPPLCIPERTMDDAKRTLAPEVPISVLLPASTAPGDEMPAMRSQAVRDRIGVDLAGELKTLLDASPH